MAVIRQEAPSHLLVHRHMKYITRDSFRVIEFVQRPPLATLAQGEVVRFVRSGLRDLRSRSHFARCARPGPSSHATTSRPPHPPDRHPTDANRVDRRNRSHREDSHACSASPESGAPLVQDAPTTGGRLRRAHGPRDGGARHESRRRRAATRQPRDRRHVRRARRERRHEHRKLDDRRRHRREPGNGHHGLPPGNRDERHDPQRRRRRPTGRARPRRPRTTTPRGERPSRR